MRIIPTACVLGFAAIISGCVDLAAQQQMIDQANKTTPICAGQIECDAKWAAARTFVINNADMKFQTYTSDFLETFNPPEYGPDIAAQVNKEPQPDGSYKIRAKFYCSNILGCNKEPAKLLLDFNAYVAGWKR